MLELIDKDDIINTRGSNIEGRVCYVCESSETYIDSEGREHWENGLEIGYAIRVEMPLI